jgi:transcription elongation GreA/GreB family factor
MNFPPSEKLQFKQKLKSQCEEILLARIGTATQAMQQAQESANSDEKSSAGDKHETGRAMGQIDRDMNARQLEEAKRELEIIHAISTETIHQKIGNGSVIISPDFIFFISLGLGTTTVNGKKIILLSPSAPIAKLMLGKKVGDHFMMNAKEIKITDVF